METVYNKQRINWLDTSRGIAFLMVIYSHLQYCDDTVMQFFSPVFLTTFFFVSGYLHKSGRPFLDVLEQRTRTLLWPLISLGTIMIVMQHLFTLKDDPLPWIDGFKGLLFQNGENTILWFVAAVYVYSIVFYWIERASGKYILWVSLFIFVLNWAYSQVLAGPSIPWHLSVSGYACAYMGLGKWFKCVECEYDRVVKSWMIYAALVLYIILLLAIGQTCSYAGSKYLIDSMILTGLGLFIMVGISKKSPLNNSRFLLFVGANTLFYFAFHGKVYAMLQAIANKVFTYGQFEHSLFVDDIVGFVITICDAIILIPFAILVNRYCKWILGKGFRLWPERSMKQ